VSYVRNLRITSFKNAPPEKNKKKQTNQTKQKRKKQKQKNNILNFFLFTLRDTNKAKPSLMQERTLFVIFSSLDI